MPKQRKKQLQELALKRVKALFSEAAIIFSHNPELANRYVQIARKTAMKVNLRLPRELKRKFCKHCYSYFQPGKTCRCRIHKSRITYYCLTCKKYTRMMLKGKKKSLIIPVSSAQHPKQPFCNPLQMYSKGRKYVKNICF